MKRHDQGSWTGVVETLAVAIFGFSALLGGCGSSGSEAPTPTTTAVAGGGGTGTASAVGGSGGAGGFVPAASGGPVAIQGVYNARHTGGLPAAGGMTVRDRTIIRSGHLADLDATGCGQLAELEIHTVIDLRQADGSTGASTHPDAGCVTATTTYYQADIIKLVPPSVAFYEQTLTAVEPKLATIFGHLGRDDGLPAILHCVIGRDRASIVTALVLLALGVSSDDVITDYVQNQHPDVRSSVAAEYMQAVIARVEAAGGIEAYLQSHGVTASEVTKLRELALQ